MSQFHLGQRVRYRRVLHRVNGLDGERKWESYEWSDKLNHPEHNGEGVVVGMRNLSNGWRHWEDASYASRERFEAVMISHGMRRKPVFVLPEHVTPLDEQATAVSTEVLNAVAAHHSDPATARAVATTDAVWRLVDSEFELLSSSEVDVLMGAGTSDRANATSLRESGDLLAIQRGHRHVFPGFQFDRAAGQIRPWVSPLLTLAAEHDRSSTDVTAWMMCPTTYLAGARPADYVADPERLLSLAEKAWSVEW